MPPLPHFHKALTSKHLATVFALLLGANVLSQTAYATADSYQRVSLALPEPAKIVPLVPDKNTIEQPTLIEHRYTLQRNQSLSHALQAVADSGNLLWRIGRHENSHYFTQLRTGDELIMWLTQENELARMELNRTPTLTYVLEANDGL
jgi:hypothetical protein